MGRPIQKRTDKVEKNLEEVGILDGETTAQDRDKWRELSVPMMDLNGLLKVKEEESL